MGLDMYLEKETYIGANWQWRELRGELILIDNVGEENERTTNIFETVKPNRVNSIVEQVAYWRKANHIHKWFVDNVQDGIDECQRSYVSYSQLVELQELCEWVLDNPDEAEAGLPTASGFFFGGTEYNQYYFDDVKYTLYKLNEILNEPHAENASYYYQSSW